MIASWCAASSGASFSSSSLVKSLESAELLLKNTFATRSSSWPLRSSGSNVFSKIGKSRLRTIACTSRELLGHARLERGLEVLVADLGERRQAVGEGAGGGEGIVGGRDSVTRSA